MVQGLRGKGGGARLSKCFVNGDLGRTAEAVTSTEKAACNPDRPDQRVTAREGRGARCMRGRRCVWYRCHVVWPGQSMGGKGGRARDRGACHATVSCRVLVAKSCDVGGAAAGMALHGTERAVRSNASCWPQHAAPHDTCDISRPTDPPQGAEGRQRDGCHEGEEDVGDAPASRAVCMVVMHERL